MPDGAERNFEDYASCVSNSEHPKFIDGMDQVIDSEQLRTQLEGKIAHQFSKIIRDLFWSRLIRCLDRDGLMRSLEDSKTTDNSLRIYVPENDQDTLNYYRDLKRDPDFSSLEVISLPADFSPEYVRTLNQHPGILALGVTTNANGSHTPRPYVVPGGRFNELCGWDSYFTILGLLADGLVELAKSTVDNLVYEVNNYGHVLNANRSYYLTRSQPPFLLAMVLEVYDHLEFGLEGKRWLVECLEAVIKEYRTWWSESHHTLPTGLARYFDVGRGFPPETETDHYDEFLTAIARDRGISISELRSLFENDETLFPDIMEYLSHDRAMRESGEDTTYRLVNRAARMNPVSLNSLLYFVESRLSIVLDDLFGGSLTLSNGEVVTAVYFSELASKRRDRMNYYLWDEESGIFLDYVIDDENSTKGKRLQYFSANCFYPLWAGLVTQEQADRIVRFAIARLEQPGGLVATDKGSPGAITTDHPQRQWDYPFGWAPHQMIAWKGLTRYGHIIQAQELMYRWVHMVILDSMRNNGAIAEKYDVIHCSQHTTAEYGNEGAGVGIDRFGAGFGWTNASIQYALTQLNVSHQRALLKLLVSSTIFGKAAGQDHQG